jgi:hypothetical protein
MAYKSDTKISQPVSVTYTSRRDMGGFGWHPVHGLFIPVTENGDRIEAPYPSGMNPIKIPNK